MQAATKIRHWPKRRRLGTKDPLANSSVTIRFVCGLGAFASGYLPLCVMSRTNNNWHNMTVNETCKTYVFLCYVWRRNAWLFGCCSLASKGALHRC